MPGHSTSRRPLSHSSLSFPTSVMATTSQKGAPSRASGLGTGEGRTGRGLGSSSRSPPLAEAAARFLWLVLTTCLKALQRRKEIFQEIKLLLFPVWLSSLGDEKRFKGT